MGRFGVIVVIGGAVLGFFGIREYRVSRGTSAAPVEIDLAKLEAKQAPSSNYVKIGEHVALYPATVYSYQTSKHSKEEPKPTTVLTYCFYPILSKSHPFLKDLDKMAAKHGGAEKIPDAEPLPEITDFAVLVKTNKFKTLGSIPDMMETQGSVEGLVINEISSLSSKEKELIKSNFAKVDLDKVLILEEGRQPASVAKWGGMIGGGALLILVGIGMFVVGLGRQG